jgi:H+/Cl- antiporter ClcA
VATSTDGRPGLRGAAKNVADRTRTLVRLEIELALSEIKRKLATIGIGIGLFVGAALFAFFAIAFTLATIAAGLATAVPWWLALLIVTIALFLLVVLLVLLGRAAIQRATPPLPEQAIEEAQLTVEALKNGAH